VAGGGHDIGRVLPRVGEGHGVADLEGVQRRGYGGIRACGGGSTEIDAEQLDIKGVQDTVTGQEIAEVDCARVIGERGSATDSIVFGTISGPIHNTISSHQRIGRSAIGHN